MSLYLANRFNDIIHIFSGAEQHFLGYPNAFLCARSFGHRTIYARQIALQYIPGEELLKEAAFQHLSHEPLSVQRIVTARARHPLGFEGFHEEITIQSSKGFLVIPEYIEMIGVLRDMVGVCSGRMPGMRDSSRSK